MMKTARPIKRRNTPQDSEIRALNARISELNADLRAAQGDAIESIHLLKGSMSDEQFGIDVNGILERARIMQAKQNPILVVFKDAFDALEQVAEERAALAAKLAYFKHELKESFDSGRRSQGWDYPRLHRLRTKILEG